MVEVHHIQHAMSISRRICTQLVVPASPPQTALEGQDLSRTYLAHHELESTVVVLIIIVVIIVVVVVIIIIIIISIIVITCIFNFIFIIIITPTNRHQMLLCTQLAHIPYTFSVWQSSGSAYVHDASKHKIFAGSRPLHDEQTCNCMQASAFAGAMPVIRPCLVIFGLC